MQKIWQSGIPVSHVSKSTSDTSSSLTDLGVTISTSGEGGRNNQEAAFVVISVEDNPIRVALGATATTSLGHKFLAGEVFVLEAQEIRIAEFISATAGNHATLQISVEY